MLGLDPLIKITLKCDYNHFMHVFLSKISLKKENKIYIRKKSIRNTNKKIIVTFTVLSTTLNIRKVF